jgi:site-specific DNA recombinase
VDGWLAYHAAFLAAGLYRCGTNPARLTADRATLPIESACSNGRPVYRCSHGHTIATAPDAGRAKNACAREDAIVPHLPALHLLLTRPVGRRKRGTRGGIDIRTQTTPRT